MRALLEDDNNQIVAYSAFQPVTMCNGDTLTVTWNLSFNNQLDCAYCGKKMRTEGESKLIQMTEVGGNYYHLCGKKCRFLMALKGKEK